MNVTTFTIESVHGVKQTLSFENFTLGPQPRPSRRMPPSAVQSTTASIETHRPAHLPPDSANPPEKK